MMSVQSLLGRFHLVIAALLVASVAQNAGSDAVQSYSVMEESAPGIILGDILAEANLSSRYNMSTVRSFEFSILKGPNMRFFTLERGRDSVLLKTSGQAIDRDALCPKAVKCDLSLDLAVSKPISYFQIVKTVISVLDKNDNAPRFPLQETELRISESATRGLRFILPVAFDPDSGDFGKVTYDLTGVDDLGEVSVPPEFGLYASEGVHGSGEVRLALNRQLDRETRSEYKLRLTAKDQGVPPKMADLAITVHVTDTNDNYPVFQQKIYNVSISEDTELTLPILQVKASDRDKGKNGKITYGLTSQTVASLGDRFSIDNNTGEVFLLRHLDYEEEQVYHLVVTALDLGPDSVPSHVNVFIHVLDVNDFVPKVTVNVLGSSNSDVAEVMENQDVGAFVCHISVEDLDRGISGQVDCSLSAHNKRDFRIEGLYLNEYKIVTNSTFDREVQDDYLIMITCSDRGSPSLTTVRDLQVRILDVNDHSPRFSQPLYTVAVRENSSFPQPVLRVHATDDDLGDNSQVTYTLQSDGRPQVLQVDRDTGVLATRTRLDYEQQKEYTVVVVAVDNGTPPRSASALVKLNVTDANDESPVFSKRVYNFGTFENQPAGTEIGTVTASDIDTVPYDEITYSVSIRSRWRHSFAIDPSIGTISTRKILDREHTAVYNLVVMATNTAPPHLSASVTINIEVADKNDNAPAIRFPTKDNDTVEVSAFALKGHVMTRVDAFDADLGKNAKLAFVMAKGNEEHLFEVIPNSGDILVHKDLQEATQGSYRLLIIVQDHGSPQKSAMANLHVVLNASIDASGHLVDFLTSDQTDEHSQDSSLGSQGISLENTIVIVIGVIAAILAMALAGVLGYLCRRPYHKSARARARAASCSSASCDQVKVSVANNCGQYPLSICRTIEDGRSDTSQSSGCEGGSSGGGHLGAGQDTLQQPFLEKRADIIRSTSLRLAEDNHSLNRNLAPFNLSLTWDPQGPIASMTSPSEVSTGDSGRGSYAENSDRSSVQMSWDPVAPRARHSIATRSPEPRDCIQELNETLHGQPSSPVGDHYPRNGDAVSHALNANPVHENLEQHSPNWDMYRTSTLPPQCTCAGHGNQSYGFPVNLSRNSSLSRSGDARHPSRPASQCLDAHMAALTSVPRTSVHSVHIPTYDAVQKPKLISHGHGYRDEEGNHLHGINSDGEDDDPDVDDDDDDDDVFGDLSDLESETSQGRYAQTTQAVVHNQLAARANDARAVKVKNTNLGAMTQPVPVHAPTTCGPKTAGINSGPETYTVAETSFTDSTV